MIKHARKRLAIVFATAILFFTGLVLAVNYFGYNHALTSGLKKYVNDEIEKDFMPYYKADNLDAITRLKSAEHFQVIDKGGNVKASSYFSGLFMPLVNRTLMTDAFKGLKGYETIEFRDQYYFVSYFHLDDMYAGRVAMSLETLEVYKDEFLEWLMLIIPVLLLVSYGVSRYLVNTAMKPISEAFTFQENFSSNVSHELRSPLTALKGNLEVTMRKERTADEYRVSIESGLKEVDRIIKVMDNLKLLASSEFRPLDLFTGKVDVRKLFADVLNVFMADMNAGNITLETSIDAGDFLLCDEALMRRALENLMSNAVKYTPAGGTIKLSATDSPNALRVVLSNTCNDLDKAETASIFDPFKRGINAMSGNIDGTGLGLYIARYIVRSHGGDISADVGNDTFSITVELPLKK